VRHLGCDPVDSILDVCRTTGVPVRIARSEFVPERLPYDGAFDLAYDFSVFTHLSEEAPQACRWHYTALRPAAIVVLTFRPSEYLRVHELKHPALDALAPGQAARLRVPRYVFVAHQPGPRHPEYHGGPMTYGEAVITLPYERERWSEWFGLLNFRTLIGHLHHVVLTLRRRP
jgi:hypothetical protein